VNWHGLKKGVMISLIVAERRKRVLHPYFTRAGTGEGKRGEGEGGEKGGAVVTYWRTMSKEEDVLEGAFNKKPMRGGRIEGGSITLLIPTTGRRGKGKKGGRGGRGERAAISRTAEYPTQEWFL